MGLCGVNSIAEIDDYVLACGEPGSFRDGPKDQTRNLEIPGSRFARPGMTLRVTSAG
jgi:hypothetical protein